MAHDVFLSYRSGDKTEADRLCSSLESNGIQCWIAPRNIPIGTEWPAAIVEAIGACKVFVMVLSSNSKNEKQISREAELADKQGCQIITFRIEDVQPPPGLAYFLGNIQWLDAFGGQFDTAVARLVQLIKKAPESAEMKSPPAVPMQPQSQSAPKKWLGFAAAGGVCLIGAGLWFVTHQAGPAAADGMSEAKSVADRFLSEREAGNLDAAWAEFADTAQNKIDKAKWIKTQADLRTGHITNKFNGCTPAGNGYYCDYTLVPGEGESLANKIWLIRNREGGWSVSRSELRRIAKS